jgi:hypothetical protein
MPDLPVKREGREVGSRRSDPSSRVVRVGLVRAAAAGMGGSATEHLGGGR